MSTSDAMPPQQPDTNSGRDGWTDPTQSGLIPPGQPIQPADPTPPTTAQPTGGGPMSHRIVMLVAVALVAGIAAFVGSVAGGFASGLVDHRQDDGRSMMAQRDFGDRQQQGPGGRGGNPGPYTAPAPTATPTPTTTG